MTSVVLAASGLALLLVGLVFFRRGISGEREQKMQYLAAMMDTVGGALILGCGAFLIVLAVRLA
jgi:hypothetical protein